MCVVIWDVITSIGFHDSDSLAIFFLVDMQEVTRFTPHCVFLVLKQFCVMFEQAWVPGPSVPRVAGLCGNHSFRGVSGCVCV